jgi:NAD(P)-dependent dehydrogenase (short-subunit alcohol dehydrogenase family)
MAREGARVCIADVRAAESESAVASIVQDGGQCFFQQTDVLDDASIRACVNHAISRYGRLDILVNNAGTHFPHTIDELSQERWDFLLDLNLKSMFLFCQAALPEIRKRQGSIINMSSKTGLVGQSNAVAYCASKAGILGLTMGLAKDEAKNRVRVNAICPSNVETPLMNEWIEKQPDPDGVRRACEMASPLGRMATILEIGAAAVFLASSDASFITGISLQVDGGTLLGA